MSLTSQQRSAAYAKVSVVVTAGAGTGKTYMLAERYLYYVRDCQISPLEIVAVTFTTKAAKELRSRIRSLISQQLPHRFDILAELEAAQISTIDALVGRICLDYPDAAEVPADFTMLGDLERSLWVDRALEEALDKLPQHLYNRVPYSLLKETLQGLHNDPIVADRALSCSSEVREIAMQKMQQGWLNAIASDPVWQEMLEVLRSHSGPEGDKREQVRQQGVDLLATLQVQLENKAEISQVAQTLEAIRTLNLRVGSAKKWEKVDFDAVGDAIKALKATISNLQKWLVLEFSAADDELEDKIAAIREAFALTKKQIDAKKYRSRSLAFADAEAGAWRALQHPEVLEDYRDRFRVFLVDEFQDTNIVQGELLEKLAAGKHLTIVGDIKQSIYGFRRAEVQVFDRFREHILAEGGAEIVLDRSFRTHHSLIESTNRIFAPLLGDRHQSLVADRATETHPQPHIEVYTVRSEDKENKGDRQDCEARNLGKLLQNLLSQQTAIYDKKGNCLRPVQPKDIAILSRTWDAISVYDDILTTLGLPVIVSGGGNLLETREAKDARSLLQFLADPRDSLALVALLRSPFFAVSDRTLYTLAQQGKSEDNQIRWWQIIKQADTAEFTELEYPITVLKQLLDRRYQEPPTRLLQKADRLTGYTAVIANLANCDRRQADWRGFRDLIRQLQGDTSDLFTTVRRLKQLVTEEVKVSRPPLEAENAITLTTIHGSKGLEWPVVVVADLARSSQTNPPNVLFDPHCGLGLQWENETGEKQEPVVYQWLKQQQQQREDDEALCLLYVALTRARDRLILTAADTKGGSLERLRPGLEAANIDIQTWMLDNETVANAPIQTGESLSVEPLVGAVGSGLFEIPVTALSEYDRCPKRFEFSTVLGYPGIGEGTRTFQRLGTLVHKAIELDIRDLSVLSRFDATLETEYASQALALAQRFQTHPEYTPFRDLAIGKEQSIALKIGSLTLNGRADLVGDNWVLDLKTDRDRNPQQHRWQLWAYARGLGVDTAYIAYLRHEKDALFEFAAKDLDAIDKEIETAIAGIVSGDYPAIPTVENCGICPYREICQFAL